MSEDLKLPEMDIKEILDLVKHLNEEEKKTLEEFMKLRPYYYLGYSPVIYKLKINVFGHLEYDEEKIISDINEDLPKLQFQFLTLLEQAQSFDGRVKPNISVIMYKKKVGKIYVR
jgi:hypothetical protein